MKSNAGTACPLCFLADNKLFLEGRDYHSSHTRQFTLVKCNGCGLVYLSPQAVAEEGQALYQPGYYRKMTGVVRGFEKLFLAERRRIVERFKKMPGVLLDIGCGTGEFIKTMRSGGWKAVGNDTSDEIKNYPEGGAEIYYKDLAAVNFDAQTFDVISLWQVLEHLTDPQRYLRETNRLLKEDGVLVMSVPNINSLQAGLSGNKWFALDLPRHIWHFTPETISEILARTGFRVKEVRHFSLEYNPFGWWQSMFNLLGCEDNFIYKYLKRGSIQKEYALGRRSYTVLCAVLLGLPFLLLAFVLTGLESVLGRGGVITVVAEKCRRNG